MSSNLWTQREDDLLKGLRDYQLSWVDIGEKLNRSSSACASRYIKITRGQDRAEPSLLNGRDAEYFRRDAINGSYNLLRAMEGFYARREEKLNEVAA